MLYNVVRISSVEMRTNSCKEQLPILVPGGSRIKGGPVLDFKDKTNPQLCRLFMSLMAKTRVHSKAVGDATKTFEER